MTTIGRFTQSKDGGWTGTIRTLTINAKVRLIPNDSRENSSAPAYRLLVGTHHIGDAWEQQTDNNMPQPYLRVRFDDLSLPGPIRAALFFCEDGVTARLTWRRKQG